MVRVMSIIRDRFRVIVKFRVSVSVSLWLTVRVRTC